MNADLEVIWNGAHFDCDADLLCVSAPAGPPPMRPVPVEEQPHELQKHRTRVEMVCERELILTALAHGEVVTVEDLRQHTGLTKFRQLEVALTILRKKRIVRSMGYGKVQLGKPRSGHEG